MGAHRPALLFEKHGELLGASFSVLLQQRMPLCLPWRQLQMLCKRVR